MRKCDASLEFLWKEDGDENQGPKCEGSGEHGNAGQDRVQHFSLHMGLLQRRRMEGFHARSEI